MNILIQLKRTEGIKKICIPTEHMSDLSKEYAKLGVTEAIEECQISLLDGDKVIFSNKVEICGMTPELLSKVCRFFFYEKAWEYLQHIAPGFTSYDESKGHSEFEQQLMILHNCCNVFVLDSNNIVSLLDENVDYLQSLEDSIRCGQVTFKDSLSDTYANQNRLATLYIAGNFEFVHNDNKIEDMISLIKDIVPEYMFDNNDPKESLFKGLEAMIGYVNSICD